MTKAWTLALALLVGASPAAAVCGDGAAFTCDDAASCDGGADAQCSGMQPPEEDDPGGCACWWGDGSSDAPAAFAWLAPAAWVIRRRGRRI